MGFLSSIFFAGITYLRLKKSLISLRIELEKAENDLSTDIRDIGILELQQTEAGRELLNLRKVTIGRGIPSPNRETKRDLAQNKAIASDKADPFYGSALQKKPNTKDKSILVNDQFVIPGFPIYGFATAGPTGEAFLYPQDLNYASGITKSSFVTLMEREYKVYPATGNERAIDISADQRFGWLKITGNSMNAVAPTPIEAGDYVLFYETHAFENLEGRIVVAMLAETDIQPPRLMVKRLVRKIVKEPFSGFQDKTTKFLLRSESSFDWDSETGVSYDRDIEITSNNQIVGGVVAIAKPISI
jgi:hypothetical protein